MSDEIKPCPFCGGEAEYGLTMAGEEVYCTACYANMPRMTTADEAIGRWNARSERTCRRVPGKMHYGERRPKCSECGYGLGDSRWDYCPKCGAKVVSDDRQS